MRFCIDFHRLNAAMIPETYPLPRMDDCIDSLSHAKIFSMLDALWGYWKIPIADEDRDKTTLTSHVGTYRYNSDALWDALWRTKSAFNIPAFNRRDLFRCAMENLSRVPRGSHCVLPQPRRTSGAPENVPDSSGERCYQAQDEICFFVKNKVECLGHCIRPGP